MQKNKSEILSYQENQFDLREILASLIDFKYFIIIFTSIFTLSAFIYASTLTPIYRTTTLFKSASENTVLKINNLSFLNETKDSIQALSINTMLSREFQTKINNDGGFSNDVDTNSIIIEPPTTLSKTNIENPYKISINGFNGEAIKKYLKELVAAADKKTINILNDTNKQKSNYRLEQLEKEIEILLDLEKLDRLAKIERIKEEDLLQSLIIEKLIDASRFLVKQKRMNLIERIKQDDGQKISLVNDKIDRARYKAKEERLNQIIVLTDAAKLAGSLGIVENNLEKISASIDSDINLNIAINEDKHLPEWYLYGEKALLERVKLLKNRNNDDPYITELVTLNNQLNEIQNNNLLKTLQARYDDDPYNEELFTLQTKLNKVKNNTELLLLQLREDDGPFIIEINFLEAEKKQIERNSKIIDNNLTSIELYKAGKLETIIANKKIILLLTLIISFIVSILLALLMSSLKPEKEVSI